MEDRGENNETTKAVIVPPDIGSVERLAAGEHLTKYENDLTIKATAVIDASPEQMDLIQKKIRTQFPYTLGELDKAQQAFEKQLGEDEYSSPNKCLAGLMPIYEWIIGSLLDDLMKLEAWLLLCLDSKNGKKGPFYAIQNEILTDVQSHCDTMRAELLNYAHDYYTARKNALGGLLLKKTTEKTETVSIDITTAAKEDGSKNNSDSTFPLRGTESRECVTETVTREGAPKALSHEDGRMRYLKVDVALYTRMLISLNRYVTLHKSILKKSIRLQHVMYSSKRGFLSITYYLACLKDVCC
jgi:hypothetical protein